MVCGGAKVGACASGKFGGFRVKAGRITRMQTQSLPSLEAARQPSRSLLCIDLGGWIERYKIWNVGTIFKPFFIVRESLSRQNCMAALQSPCWPRIASPLPSPPPRFGTGSGEPLLLGRCHPVGHHTPEPGSKPFVGDLLLG